MPASETQLPLFEPRAPRVSYDLWHGYRRLQHQGQVAAYPFGFGLSYSRFELGEPQARLHDDPEADRAWLELELEVANRGSLAAAEVVQVYLEAPGRRLERPQRTLVAFERVALEAATAQHIRLAIPLRRLACFDPDRDGFILEAGLHRLVVARHADDPGQSASLMLEDRFVGR